MPNKDEIWANDKKELLKRLTARVLLLNLAVHRARSPDQDWDAVGQVVTSPEELGLEGIEFGKIPISRFDEGKLQLKNRVFGDPEIAARLEKLKSMGYEFELLDSQFHGVFAYSLFIKQNLAADCYLRAEAKVDAGVKTKQESFKYDQQWQMYFNQNYSTDWKIWKEIAEVVDWP